MCAAKPGLLRVCVSVCLCVCVRQARRGKGGQNWKARDILSRSKTHTRRLCLPSRAQRSMTPSNESFAILSRLRASRSKEDRAKRATRREQTKEGKEQLIFASIRKKDNNGKEGQTLHVTVFRRAKTRLRETLLFRMCRSLALTLLPQTNNAKRTKRLFALTEERTLDSGPLLFFSCDTYKLDVSRYLF